MAQSSRNVLSEKLISEGLASSKTVADKIIGCVLNGIKEEVKESGKASFVGFGTFEKKYTNERKGKNPQTGEPMVIPAKNVVKFKPGKTFKDFIL